MKRELTYFGGLTAAEAMACKTATLLPEHSAFAEWAKGATHFMKADQPQLATNTLNTVHYLTDKESAIDGLRKMYTDKTYRDEIALAGYNKMNEPQYRWQNVAKRFLDIFQGIA